MSMKIVLIVFIFLIVSLISLCNGKNPFHRRTPPSKNSYDFELSIIHMNDFHASFEESNSRLHRCRRDKGQTCYGGLPRLAAVTKQLRKIRPNHIFLNAGDQFYSTPWYNVFGWNATTTFLNMLSQDVTNIGNHEFDGEIENGLVPYLENIKADVVLANVDMKNEPKLKDLIKSHVVIDKYKRKIGVIGIIYQDVPESAKTGNLDFLDEVQAVDREAEKLKNKENVDIIIVLSHAGFYMNKQIAKKCKGVDIIVSGHAHELFYHGRPPSPFYSSHSYPYVVNQTYPPRTVLIVDAYSHTRVLGDLTVWFDGTGEVQDWDGNAIILDDTFKEDEEMLEKMKPWKAELDEKLNEIVGKTYVKLNNDCNDGECNIGNMITDAMVESYIDREEEKNYWTYVAIAVNFPGGITNSIDLYDGYIKYIDLLEVLLYGETWDIIEMQGKDIRKTISDAVFRKNWKITTKLVWSGIKAVFDKSGSSKELNLVDVKVRCQKCAIPIYEDLNDTEWYRVVTPAFMLRKGNRFAIATKNKNRETGIKDIDGLVKYVRKMSPLISGKERRLQFVD